MASHTILDIQSKADTRNLAVNQVGIKDIRYPVVVRDRHARTQSSVANFDLYVDLSPTVKGTHMSRFVEILQEQPIVFDVSHMDELLHTIRTRLGSKASFFTARFPFFMEKSAPISGIQSLMDYNVTLQGCDFNDTVATYVQVVVPVTSLCPCSKSISQYGAHNQRSHITVTIQIDPQNPVWIEELIGWVENQASCALYGILKRPDEKYVTEHAYENPKFVEDLVRDIAAVFEQESRILAYVVSSENFESIHNHSAYALIHKGMAAAHL